MRPITKEQRKAIFRIYSRNAAYNPPTYRAFRKTVVQGYDCLMVQWSGMWLGIEKDGHTHS